MGFAPSEIWAMDFDDFIYWCERFKEERRG